MHAPEVLKELALLLAAAVLIVYVFRKLRQPAILGFLVCGALIGPHGLALIREVSAVETLAEVGVILLLFGIGLEFSIARLARIGRYVVIGGGAQAIATAGITLAAALAMDMSWQKGLFWGAALTLSSTAIVLRLLSDQRQLDSLGGQIALGILLFQDLLIVPIMLFLPLLGAGDGGAGAGPLDFLIILGKAVLVLLGVVVGARYVAPRVLKQAAQSGSRELFTLTVILFALGTAILTSLAGLSLALGAFLAGLVIAESDYGDTALSEILPIHDALAGLFFISIGMLLNWAYVGEHLLDVAALSVAIIVLKSAAVAAAIYLLSRSARIGIACGMILAQVGEFSFLVAQLGYKIELIGSGEYQAFLASSILTMLATPFLMRIAPATSFAVQSLREKRPSPGGAPSAGTENKQGHIILIGYGLTGRNMSRVLGETGLRFLGLEMNAARAAQAQQLGFPFRFGDATRREVLRKAGVEEARVLVVAIADPVATRRIVAIARRMNPDLHVIVRTRYVSEIEELVQIGADQVVPEEFETSIELFARVLEHYHIPRNVIALQRSLIRQAGYGVLRGGAPLERVEHLTEILSSSATQTALVLPESPVIGRSLGELEFRKSTGASVLAVVREGVAQNTPGPDTRLAGGDILVLTGTHAAIDAALELIRPPGRDGGDTS